MEASDLLKTITRGVLVSLLLLPVFTLAANCDRFYVGLYYWGAEVNTFQPCGSKHTYWVSASSWVLSPLKQYLQTNASEPYRAVYIEMRGHLLDEKTDGFASQYDGLIRISEVISKDVEIPPGCKQPEKAGL